MDDSCRGDTEMDFFKENGKIIAEKLWAKVSPLCTMIATDVPERMTIKAPQTNQNHLQYDINFTLLDYF